MPGGAAAAGVAPVTSCGRTPKAPMTFFVVSESMPGIMISPVARSTWGVNKVLNVSIGAVPAAVPTAL